MQSFFYHTLMVTNTHKRAPSTKGSNPITYRKRTNRASRTAREMVVLVIYLYMSLTVISDSVKLTNFTVAWNYSTEHVHTYLDIEVPILVRQCAALAQSVKRRTLKAFETNVFVVGSRPASDIFFSFVSVIQATKRFAIAWRLFLAVRKRNIKSVFCTFCINTQLLLVQSCLVVRRIYFYSNFAKYLSIADFCNNSDCYLHFTWGLL